MTAKHGVVPTVTINAPATAGPTTRAVFITTPLRLTALARSPRRYQSADEGLPGGGVDDLDEAAEDIDRDDHGHTGRPGRRQRPQHAGEHTEE